MPRPITPPVACDCIIELVDRPGRPVVLVERRFPPPGWAIPGGFMEPGETVEQAATREAREETGLAVALVALLGVYSDPRRDPRGQTVGVVFVGEARGTPRAGDDAGAAQAFDPFGVLPPLAFDHAAILGDYRAWRRDGRLPAPRSP
jgi:8-oxo-dGTP diphosphatase